MSKHRWWKLPALPVRRGRDSRLQQELAQVQQQSQANERMLAFSRDVLCAIDENGYFVSVSPACRNLLGYAPEELSGHFSLDFMLPEDRERSREAVLAILRGTSCGRSQFRNRYRHRDGHAVTLMWTAKWSPRDRMLFCVGRDISAELATEKLARRRETFFALSPEMFCIVGQDQRFVEVNQAFLDVLGYSRGDLLEQSYRNILHPDDYQATMTAIERMLDGHTIRGLEIRALDHQGQEHWLRLSAVVGDDQLIYCTARDITEIRKAEQALRKLAERQTRIFESMTDAFFTLDRQWRLTYLNSRSEALLRSSRETILGKTFRDAFPGHENSVFEIQYREAFATGKSVSFEAYSAPLHEWFDVNAYPSEDGLAVYFRSISDRKQADARLQATLAELERSNRELEDFAFVASHDLQEPLRKIQTFSDRLSQRTEHLDADEQDYLERMRSAARRMQALIQDLLDYSRISTRSRAFVECDLNDMLDNVLRDLETTVTETGASIHAGSLLPVAGDRTQLRQVLQNLLSNALKFCHRAPRIHVLAEEVGAQGWTLVVRDNGIGFDPEYRDRIFQPFQRLQSRNQYPGTGIGLAIVKKILDRHGAAITVDSDPGQGTCFRIRFPRAPADGPTGSNQHE